MKKKTKRGPIYKLAEARLQILNRVRREIDEEIENYIEPYICYKDVASLSRKELATFKKEMRALKDRKVHAQNQYKNFLRDFNKLFGKP